MRFVDYHDPFSVSFQVFCSQDKERPVIVVDFLFLQVQAAQWTRRFCHVDISRRVLFGRFQYKKTFKRSANDEAVEKLLVKETMQQLEESDEHTHIVQGEAE